MIRFHYDGIMDAYREFYDLFNIATHYNIEEVNNVTFMFKRHFVGIRNATATRANNGKTERMNGSIKELQTIGRGYKDAQHFHIVILFFYGKLNVNKYHRFPITSD